MGVYGCEMYCGLLTVVLAKTLESPLDIKEIKLDNLKGNQPWKFTGRTDAEAETPILWPPGVKSWLIRKNSDAGKIWGQEKGATDDEMVGWYHWLNGHEFEKTQEDSDRQRSLACCSSWGCKGRIWLSDWATTITIADSYWYMVEANTTL